MKKGSILVGILILLSGLIVMGIGLTSAVLSTNIKTHRAYEDISALAYAEAGIDKALFEISEPSSAYTGTTGPDDSLNGGEFETTVTSCGVNCKQILSTGYVNSKDNPGDTKQIRVKIKDVPTTTSVAFNYGIQAGNLGITMNNSSSVIGNIYASGTIKGVNSANVTGDVIMSGASGKIQGLIIKSNTDGTGGNAKAHTITGAKISKDAWFQSLSSSTVGGTQHPNSPDPVDIDLPIQDSTIYEWEEQAALGGTYEGNLTLSSTTRTYGPKKINGNLTITNNSVLTLTGSIWVTGSISISNSATIKLDTGYGSNAGIIIANGLVNVSNNVNIQGSGDARSFIMLLSMYTGNPAINITNSSAAIVYYAPHGIINISNNARVKSLTAKGLSMSNSSQVIYDTGLANAEFTGGPGGTWQAVEWQVIH